jgi:nitroimidazol reductase NimA-like FMN-containing flavoprotein (pyridoxamine 5'-phosphate oxidase superfamily)
MSMDTPASHTVMEALSEEECLELLAGQQVGRVAVVVDGQPEIFPVNFRIDGGTVVFRTDMGSKLHGAVLAKVAFQVDHLDEANRLGWTVMIQGTGFDMTDTIDARSEELRQLPVVPWAPGEKAYWVKIVASVTSGRRLRPSS